jgi:rare lipoprotein A (peptidoglycan hydrolase)
MRRILAQRQLALAGVAILGVTGSLAITSKGAPHAARLPSAQGSYTALAASSGPQAVGKTTACGAVIRARTEGVANPVLPCWTRLYVTYRGKHVLVSVIDRGPQSSTRQFDLTQALAQRLGLTGVKRIRWSYVGSG